MNEIIWHLKNIVDAARQVLKHCTIDNSSDAVNAMSNLIDEIKAATAAIQKTERGE